MIRENWALAFTIALVAVLTVATGPLGPFSISPATSESLGSGSANLSVESVPTSATLTAGTYTDVYYLDVPPAGVAIGDVRGSPLLTMSLTIEELGYSRSSVFVLSTTMVGEHSFEISRDSLELSNLTADQLDGTLQMVLRDGDGERVLVDRNVTVVVVE